MYAASRSLRWLSSSFSWTRDRRVGLMPLGDEVPVFRLAVERVERLVEVAGVEAGEAIGGGGVELHLLFLV